MNLEETLDTLKSLGTEKARKTYQRHGVGEDVYGVSYAHFKDLKKKIKTDHALALGLWKSGNHDARVLAMMVADPARLDAETLDDWAAGLGNYVESDALAGLAAQAPQAPATMARWMASDREWIAAAGWRTLAHLARQEDGLAEADYESYLATIENGIAGSPNRVRHEMNSALIAIGGYHPALTAKALAAAARIGKVVVDHGDTDCETPDAAKYIKKMLEKKKGK
ncbi:MAG TPA: DNA alkylation repair protein [Thermoanaerobaculia bacterium]|nr:DNA alkylation repair protein [Thermoanaerobaculia bacterium]